MKQLIIERIKFHKAQEGFYMHGNHALKSSEAIELAYQHALIRTELEDILNKAKNDIKEV